jgi:hypothetical protein
MKSAHRVYSDFIETVCCGIFFFKYRVNLVLRRTSSLLGLYNVVSNSYPAVVRTALSICLRFYLPLTPYVPGQAG